MRSETMLVVTEALVKLGRNEAELPPTLLERAQLLANDAVFWAEMSRGLTEELSRAEGELARLKRLLS